MADDRQDNIKEILEEAVKRELAEHEELVWCGQPDTQAMAWPIIVFPLCVLSGLFLYSISALQNGTEDMSQTVNGMIVLLAIFGVTGIIEAIAVPYQAGRTIYALTNLRTFALRLRGKFGYQGMDNYDDLSSKLVRKERDTRFFFFAYTIPIHLMLLFMLVNFSATLANGADLLVIGSFAVVTLGWIYQGYQDLRYPLPQFREFPRAFFVINEWLATLETVPHNKVDRTILHALPSGNGDIFLVSHEKGCMRMKSIPDAREVFRKLDDKMQEESVDQK